MELSYLERRRQMKQGVRPPDSPKAKKPLNRVSPKTAATKAEEKRIIEADKQFYIDVWNASPHSCIQCGVKLPKEPLTLFFHHLLEKRNYRQFRHTPENIAIVCPDCHTQAETNIDKVPKIKARRDEVAKLLLS